MKRRGFSLVEMLIGMLLMTIIMGAITSAMHSGVTMYHKTNANSLIVNALRFSTDSFNREIAPMLSETHNIEILEKVSDVPAVSSVPENIHYIFANNGAIVHRTMSSDTTLAGSEFIEELSFSIPKQEGTENGIWSVLSMDIRAKYKETTRELAIQKALYNKPAKSGAGAGDNYVGSVLKFTALDKGAAQELTVTLNVVNDDNGKNLNKKQVAKDSIIRAQYEIALGADILASGSNPDGTNVSVQWYIATTSSAADADYYPLCSRTGSISTGGRFDTTGDTDTENLTNRYSFYISDNGTKNWDEINDINGGKFGIIRYKLTYNLTKDGVSYVGEKWSDWTELTVEDSASDTLTRDLFDTVRANIEDGNPQGIVPGTAIWIKNKQINNSETTLMITEENGEEVLIITPSSNAPKNTVDIAVDLTATSKNEDLYLGRFGDNVSDVTSLTNYTLIVDAQVVDNDAYGVFINGAIDADGNDFGYDFHYRSKLGNNELNSFLVMRAFALSNNFNDINTEEHSFTYGIDYEYRNGSTGGNSDPLTSKYFASRNTQRYWSAKHMQNNLFKFYGGFSDRTFWTSRQRMVYTILEYYDNDRGRSNPRYIVRARYMKNPKEVLAGMTLEQRYSIKQTDPWHIGKNFYLSEPIWFGDFIGTNAKVTTSGTQKFKLDYNTKCFSNNHSGTAKITWSNLDMPYSSYEPDITDRYTVKVSFNSKNNDTSTYSGVFRAKTLDIRNELQTNFNGSDKVETESISTSHFSDITRPRYIGLSAWNSKAAPNGSTGTKIWEFNLAPGFSAEELKAILPAEARLYNTNEILGGTGSWLPQINMNSTVFGQSEGMSDGIGNNSIYRKLDKGVLGLQHTTSTQCMCPFCRTSTNVLHPEATPEAAIGVLRELLVTPGNKAYEFFASRKTAGTTLDSNGTNWGQYVNPILVNTFGEAMETCSWVIIRCYNNKDLYDIFWAEDDISEMSIGTTVNVTAYLSSDPEPGYYRGTAIITQKSQESVGTYMVIVPDTFQKNVVP